MKELLMIRPMEINIANLSSNDGIVRKAMAAS
jgi:hypothetical protein